MTPGYLESIMGLKVAYHFGQFCFPGTVSVSCTERQPVNGEIIDLARLSATIQALPACSEIQVFSRED